MKKKLFLITIAMVFLIFSSCAYAGWFDSKIKVGDTDFKLPDGYHEGKMNKFGAVNITNGTNSIFLFEQDDANIQKYINNYKKEIQKQNQSMTIKNFTIDNIVIYKTNNNNNPNTIHYWFVKNNKTYDVYTWDGNKDMDSIVINLIKS